MSLLNFNCAFHHGSNKHTTCPVMTRYQGAESADILHDISTFVCFLGNVTVRLLSLLTLLLYRYLGNEIIVPKVSIFLTEFPPRQLFQISSIIFTVTLPLNTESARLIESASNSHSAVNFVNSICYIIME